MTAYRFFSTKNVSAKNAIQFSNTGYHVTANDVTVTLWQTVIYFVYKWLLNYCSFKAIAGCPPDSSASRTARHNTQRAAHGTGCRPTAQISSQKTNGLQIRRIQTHWTIACGVQCWKLTAGLKQSRKQSRNSRNRFRLSRATYHKDRSTRLWKTSQIKRLKAGVGHFEHLQWQWNFDIWSLVNCAAWLVSTMLLNWCCNLNIFSR